MYDLLMSDEERTDPLPANTQTLQYADVTTPNDAAFTTDLSVLLLGQYQACCTAVGVLVQAGTWLKRVVGARWFPIFDYYFLLPAWTVSFLTAVFAVVGALSPQDRRIRLYRRWM